MTRLAFLSTLVAAFAVAEPVAFPPAAVETPSVKAPLPFFGHKAGNFQPTKKLNINATATIALRAVGEWVQISQLANWSPSNINENNNNAGHDVYNMHWGSGTTGEGWPDRSSWVSFENMFNANKGIMFSSCSQYGQPNDSGGEVGAIWDSIQQVASETGVDHRVILAVIIQESGGCARVWTSNYGVRNPGLMQCHNGAGTCNSDITGQVQNPCPTGVITQMIREGTAGTNDGDGLANCINQSGWTSDGGFYRAARIYNSGSIDGSSRLECGIATHCYASDIANRLTGWVNAPHSCPCDDNFASCGC